MTSMELLPWLLAGGLGLLGLGLAYFIFIGVRAIYRGAQHTALDAGHRQAAARARAILRMVVWSVYFGAFYFFLYFVGRRFEAWALLPGAVGLAALIWGLLQADRLLILPAHSVRAHVRIGASFAAILAAFGSAIWYASH